MTKSRLQIQATLSVSFLGGFESLVDPLDEFIVVDAGTIQGGVDDFANVSAGIYSVDNGTGNVRIDGGNQLVLFNFQINVVPEPSAFVLTVLGLLLLAPAVRPRRGR